MDQPLVQAGLRGLVAAGVTAGAAFFATLGSGAPLRTAAIAAGSAGFAVLVVRFGAEGSIDQARQAAIPTSLGGPVAPPPAAPTTPPAPSGPRVP